MTWGERIDTRLHAKDSAAQECMAIVRALAAERDALQGLLKKSLEREEQIEKELSEARAQVAVLRGAMETAVDYLYNPFEPDNQCAQYKNIKNILQTTPAEAAERVQKLVEVEQAAREYVESNSIKMSIWLGSSESLQMEKINKLEALRDALDALSEWRRDKCSS